MFPPRAGEKASPVPLPRTAGEKDLSRYSRLGGALSPPLRSSRYGLKLSRKASRRTGGGERERSRVAC